MSKKGMKGDKDVNVGDQINTLSTLEGELDLIDFHDNYISFTLLACYMLPVVQFQPLVLKVRVIKAVNVRAVILLNGYV